MVSATSSVTRRGVLLALVLAVGTITVLGTAPRLMSLLASTTSSLYSTPATMYISTDKTTDLIVGKSHQLDINVNTKVPINTVGATLSYPSDYFEVVGMSKEKSFLDLWTEETVIREDVGEIHFSGGTYQEGGLMGTGTVLTLTMRAKKTGDATISFKEAQLYPHDGSGIEVETTRRTIAFSIVDATNTPSGAGKSTPPSPLEPAPPVAPDPDLNGDGTISVIDVSILAFKILGTYDARYDLDRNGALGLSDLSVLFASKK